MSEKLDVKSAALICGAAAADVAADVDAVEEDVVDELHPETTSPKESNAPVSATDLRAVSIDIPSGCQLTHMALSRIVTPSRLSATAQGCRYQTVMSNALFKESDRPDQCETQTDLD
jgi:hypothetical protein